MKYFKTSEFDSPDLPGSGSNMQVSFCLMLDHSREILGAPIRVNSGYRTSAHNKKVGGAAKSSHLTGHAADLAAPDRLSKRALLKALYAAGFRRFGIMRTAIHVDNDPAKAPAVWDYPGQTLPHDWEQFGSIDKISQL